ncbi:MAG: hypothetical protein ACYS26_15100 [Planctomycetota bacterium]|jgi:hypothetical protein
MQHVTVNSLAYHCCDGVFQPPLAISYYETYLVIKGKSIEDTFSTPEMPDDHEAFWHQYGDAKFIPYNEDTAGLLDELGAQVGNPMGPWSRPGKAPNGKTTPAPVLDSSGTPVDTYDGQPMTSGSFPNHSAPPSTPGYTWENDYGGHALSIDTHSMEVAYECCPCLPFPVNSSSTFCDS